MSNAIEPSGCRNLKPRRFTRVVTPYCDRRVSDTGLQNTPYALLSHTVDLGPIRPRDLAKRMHMEAPTSMCNRQPLVAHGCLKTGAGHDVPSRFLEATETGRAQRAAGAARLEGGAGGAQQPAPSAPTPSTHQTTG